MDITPQDNTTQPISDDQELAKALAGVLPDEPEDMQFEETPAVAPAAAPAPVVPPAPAPVIEVPTAPVDESADPVISSDLEGIKSQALTELRPLIDRVDLPVEEKFDA